MGKIFQFDFFKFHYSQSIDAEGQPKCSGCRPDISSLIDLEIDHVFRTGGDQTMKSISKNGSLTV